MQLPISVIGLLSFKIRLGNKYGVNLIKFIKTKWIKIKLQKDNGNSPAFQN